MYMLAEQEFTSKRAIEGKMREIVATYPEGTILELTDHDLVEALLNWHPNSEQKIGIGVRSIKKVISAKWKTPGFMILRTDGSSTDFSWRQCLYPRTKRADVVKACREAVSGQIMEYRNDFLDKWEGPYTCPITLKDTPVTELHVDHTPPWTFAVIFDAWIKANKINISTVKLEGHGDNSEMIEFADSELAESFANCHLKFAKLRMVSAEGNHQIEREFRAQKEQGRPRELRPLFKLMLEEGTLMQDKYDALVEVLDRFDRQV